MLCQFQEHSKVTVTHTFFFSLFSLISYCKILCIAPCAIQQILVDYLFYIWVCAKPLQSYLTLCNPMDCNPPDSSVHGIFQARILEWVAIPFSRGSSRPRDQTCVSMSPALVGSFFTTGTTWEGPLLQQSVTKSLFLMSPLCHLIVSTQLYFQNLHLLPSNNHLCLAKSRTHVSVLTCLASYQYLNWGSFPT